MKIEIIKTKKLLVSLLGVLVISFILGVLFLSVLSDEGKTLVTTSINNYFSGINSGKINYLSGFINSLGSGLLINLFVWVMGISIIGVFVVYGCLIIKSFLVGFSLCSILYTYGFRGILVGLIYILPEIIGLFILFVVSYYAVSFSVLLFNYLFKKKEYNKKVIVSRYLKLLLFSSLFIVVNSLISVFLVPNILRVF